MMNKMKLNYISGVLFTLLIGALHADDSGKDLLPKQPRYSDFLKVLEKNPFGGLEKPPVKVVKKPVEEAPKEEEPKEEYVLKGVSKFSEGWFVVLANKKTPREDVMIHQNKENELEIKILDVKQDKYDFTKTIVTIESEGVKQDITYNPAFFAKSKTPTKPPVKGSTGSRTSSSGKTSNGSSSKRTFSRPSGKPSSRGSR